MVFPDELARAEWLAGHASPAAVLRAAHDNPVLHMVLHYWRRGEMTWDETIAYAVTLLAEENRKLLKAGIDLEMRSTPKGDCRLCGAAATRLTAFCDACDKGLMEGTCGCKPQVSPYQAKCVKCGRFVCNVAQRADGKFLQSGPDIRPWSWLAEGPTCVECIEGKK